MKTTHTLTTISSVLFAETDDRGFWGRGGWVLGVGAGGLGLIERLPPAWRGDAAGAHSAA